MELSKELKVPAKHVYTVIVKQQIINSVVWFFVYFALAILIFILVRLKNTRVAREGYDDIVEMLEKYIIVVSTILLGVILFTFHVVVRGLINPEFGALKTIANFFINL